MKNLGDAMTGVHHQRAKGHSSLKQNAKRQLPATPPRREYFDSNSPALYTPSPVSTSSFTTSTGVTSARSTTLGSPLPIPTQQHAGPYDSMQGYYGGGGYIPYTPSPVSAVGFPPYNLGSSPTSTSWINPSPAPALQGTLVQNIGANSLFPMVPQPVPASETPANAAAVVHNQYQRAIPPAVPQIQRVQQYQVPAAAFSFDAPQASSPWPTPSPQVQQLRGTERMVQAAGLINQPLALPLLPDSSWSMDSMDEQREDNTMAIDPALPETTITPDQPIQTIVPAQQRIQRAQVHFSDEEEAMNWEGEATNMNVMAASAEEGRQHTARICRPMVSNGPPRRVIIPASPRPKVTPPHPPQMPVAAQSNAQQPLTSPAPSAVINRPKISNGAPVRVIIPARPRPKSASQVQSRAVAPTPSGQPQPLARIATSVNVSSSIASNDHPVGVINPAPPRPQIAPPITARRVYAPVDWQRMLAPVSEEEEAMHREGGQVDMGAMAAAAERARQDAVRAIEAAQQAITPVVATLPGTGTAAQEPFDYIRAPLSMPAPPQVARDMAPTVVPALAPAAAPELDMSQIDPSLRPAFMDQPLAPPPPTRPNFRLPIEDHSPEINPDTNLPEPEPWTAPGPLAQAPVPPQNSYPAAQPVLAQANTGNGAEGVVDMNAMAEQAAADRAETAKILQEETLYNEFGMETDSEEEAESSAPAPPVPAPATTTQVIIGKRKISTRPQFKATRRSKSPKQSADQDAASASGSEGD
ncbi:hypothetical protein QFC20_006745 [Naganishia adeliensis]|uniref:Uncharacterized protein n=1 Tax=Naganishia adeliensis TaxID=92952 RepID=A0ACC2V6W0_9TREE|nr:hypothetical protein QFC20_006745 [Naganishia adeliensis]